MGEYTLTELLEAIAAHGWSFSLRWERGEAHMNLWRDEWVSDCTSTARALPTFQAPSFLGCAAAAVAWMQERKKRQTAAAEQVRAWAAKL